MSNLSTTTDFLPLYVECISISFLSNHDIIVLLQNLIHLLTHIIFDFHPDLFKFFLKSVSNCNAFFYCKETTHVYLPKISITHNKKRISLLNLLNNWISAKSAP